MSGPVTRLVLTGTEGSVRVRPGDGPVTVAEKVSFTRDEPTTSHRVEGSTLFVDVNGCGKTARHDRCDVAFDIRLPGSTALEVTLVADAGSKDVSVTVDPGSAHRVTALTDAGDVTVTAA